jgi:uncharacterized damage-inducible protein DinB
MSALQPKVHLRTLLERVHHMVVKDLQAIETEKLTASPGGVARDPLHIAAELGMANRYFADYLATRQLAPRPSPEEREAHMRSFDTLEKALTYLDQETQNLLSVIDGLDENTLGETTNDMFRLPMTLFAVAEFAAMHMMYHDGQLNYIHTLYGDKEIHWW